MLVRFGLVVMFSTFSKFGWSKRFPGLKRSRITVESGFCKPIRETKIVRETKIIGSSRVTVKIYKRSLAETI